MLVSKTALVLRYLENCKTWATESVQYTGSQDHCSVVAKSYGFKMTALRTRGCIPLAVILEGTGLRLLYNYVSPCVEYLIILNGKHSVVGSDLSHPRCL